MNEIDIFPEANNLISKEVDGVAWKKEAPLLVVPAEHPINEVMKSVASHPVKSGRTSTNQRMQSP